MNARMNKFMLTHSYLNNSHLTSDAVGIFDNEGEAWKEAERLYNKSVRKAAEFMDEDDNFPKFISELLMIKHGNDSKEYWTVSAC